MNLTIDNMEFETTRTGVRLFRFKVRRPGGPWVQGREPIHGRASDKKTRVALAHYGRLDLEHDEATDGDCGQCEGTGTIEGGLGGDGPDEECPVCDGTGMLAE